jgi:predicted methyltransferase
MRHANRMKCKFYGVKAGDKVADIWAGRGYYTAILAQVVGPNGVVYSVNPSARRSLPSGGKSPQLRQHQSD